MKKPSVLFLLFLSACAAAASSSETVLVSGATGHTGYLIYTQLKAAGFNVRALVRNATKAQNMLDCGNCTEAEGIYIGDVTDESSMTAAFTDIDRVVIATGAEVDPKTKKYVGGKDMPKKIDWLGTRSQAILIAKLNPTRARHVVQISAGLTTTPNNFLDKVGDGWGPFYKLVAEADVMSLSIPFTIIKPTGLTEGPGGKLKLLTGHDDEGFNIIVEHSIAREDVAAIAVEAIQNPELSHNLRFDVTSSPLRLPTPYKEVLANAAFPWQNRTA